MRWIRIKKVVEESASRVYKLPDYTLFYHVQDINLPLFYTTFFFNLHQGKASVTMSETKPGMEMVCIKNGHLIPNCKICTWKSRRTDVLITYTFLNFLPIKIYNMLMWNGLIWSDTNHKIFQRKLKCSTNMLHNFSNLEKMH